MELIATDTLNNAWIETLKALILRGRETGSSKYFRDEPVSILVKQPKLAPADPAFPMSQADLDIINHYITTGENENKVCHEWTKIYYHRMFDEPHSQAVYFLNQLRKDGDGGRAQLSIWDKMQDQEGKVAPCTQVVWGKIRHGALELHTHARCCDAYGKLLMNLMEFVALQIYFAKELGIPCGSYYHIIDSCHIHSQDAKAAEDLARKR